MKYHFSPVGTLSLLLAALIALVFVASGEDKAKAHGEDQNLGFSLPALLSHWANGRTY